MLTAPGVRTYTLNMTAGGANGASGAAGGRSDGACQRPPPPVSGLGLVAARRMEAKGGGYEGGAEEELRSQLREMVALHAARICEMFAQWDDDGNGAVDQSEFRRALRALGLTDASDADLDDVFSDFDTDGSGYIYPCRRSHPRPGRGGGGWGEEEGGLLWPVPRHAGPGRGVALLSLCTCACRRGHACMCTWARQRGGLPPKGGLPSPPLLPPPSPTAPAFEPRVAQPNLARRARSEASEVRRAQRRAKVRLASRGRRSAWCRSLHRRKARPSQRRARGWAAAPDPQGERRAGH